MLKTEPARTNLRVIRADNESVYQYLIPTSLIKNLYAHRWIIYRFTIRDLSKKYKGTYLGLLWSLVNPIVSLMVYTLVFGYVLNARFAVDYDHNSAHYPLMLFCGIVIYSIFSGCISTAPNVIITNYNFVKKVVFPLEILVIKNFTSNLVNAFLGFLILLAVTVLFIDKISQTFFLFPLVLFPLFMLTLGLSWTLSAACVFIRDIGQVISVLLQLLFFMSAIVFPISAIPAKFQMAARLNPLVTIMENGRRTMIMGEDIEWGWWILVTVISFIVLQLGYFIFMSNKRKFADIV